MLNYTLYISKSYGKQNLPFRSAFVFLTAYVFQDVTVIVLLLSGIIYLFLSVFRTKTILLTASQICLMLLDNYPTGKDQLLKFNCVINVMIGNNFFFNFK